MLRMLRVSLCGGRSSVATAGRVVCFDADDANIMQRGKRNKLPEQLDAPAKSSADQTPPLRPEAGTEAATTRIRRAQHRESD